jgi:hypothetical protein
MSVAITFNLALACHISAVQLFNQHHHEKNGSHSIATPQAMQEKGMSALRQANALYRLSLQVLTRHNDTRVPENRTLFPIILNNLSHTHKALGESNEALECDQTLLKVLIDLQLRTGQFGSGVNTDETAADNSYGHLDGREVRSLLEAFLDNVWYLTSFIVSAAVA